MAMLMILKGTVLLLGLVALIFMVLVLAEFAFFYLLDRLDERRLKRKRDEEWWVDD